MKCLYNDTYIFGIKSNYHHVYTLNTINHCLSFLNLSGIFCSTTGILSKAATLSASSSNSSCFLKCAMSSGCIKSSSFVFSSWYLPHISPIFSLYHTLSTLRSKRKQNLLLPMMNLILHLNIPMMSWPEPKIWQQTSSP